MLTGTLSGLDLVDGRAADQWLPIQHRVQPKGSLRLADLGFYDLRVFATLSAAEVSFLTKIDPTASVGYTPQQLLSLVHFVEHLGVIDQ